MKQTRMNWLLHHVVASVGLRAVASILFVVFSTLIGTLPVHAAQTVPYKVDFQGRLTDSQGNVMPDGSYNMKFRLMTASSGGTNLWQADRVYTGSGTADHRVVVTNGIFNVQLGDTATGVGDPALSPAIFNTQTNATVYLEVELPTPATARCAAVSCGSFTEGAMTPRQLVSSAPYAMNSDAIDGIDGASLAQLSANQTFTGNNTFSGTILQQNTSATAFRVQNAGGTNALLIDTSSLAVKVGGGDVTPDASPALLVLDYKNTTGDPTGTSGGMYYNLAIKKFRCYENGTWGDCIPETRTRFEHHADFLMGGPIVNGTGVDQALIAGSANSAVFSRITGELNHPGLVRLDIGTNFFGGGFVAIASNFDAGNATAGVKFGGAVWTTSQLVRLNALSDATNNFASYNGFIDNLNSFTSNALQNGCTVIHNYQINSGRWAGACVSAGVSTTCDPLDSGSQPLPAISTSAWYTLTTTVNAAGTLATFVVEGNGVIGTCTISTNIPTSTLAFGTAMFRLAGTGAGYTLDLDYIETKATGFSRN